MVYTKGPLVKCAEWRAGDRGLAAAPGVLHRVREQLRGHQQGGLAGLRSDSPLVGQDPGQLVGL